MIEAVTMTLSEKAVHYTSLTSPRHHRYGFVAVAINMCYGVAALFVGWFVAGRWRAMGVSSAAEFLQLRFGGAVVQFYTWFQGAVNIGSLGGAI